MRAALMFGTALLSFRDVQRTMRKDEKYASNEIHLPGRPGNSNPEVPEPLPEKGAMYVPADPSGGREIP